MTAKPDSKERAKRNASLEALKLVKNNSVIGLGSGSTAAIFVRLLSEKAKRENLKIRCVATSSATEKLAKELGLNLVNLASAEKIDLAVDGTDLVDSKLNLIKGGGGAHAREKIIAYSAKKFIVIADESKIAKKLSGKVPLEVFPFAVPYVLKILKERFKVRCSTRQSPSDNGNVLIDAFFNGIKNPGKLEKELKSVSGIVENGIFSRNVSSVIIGSENGARTLKKK